MPAQGHARLHLGVVEAVGAEQIVIMGRRAGAGSSSAASSTGWSV
jgi:hypothetical protein